MSRTSFLVFAITFGLSATGAECRAQVGFGALPGLANSGIGMNVSPIVTNARRYARIGVSASFSQVVGFETFSPVRGYPGLVPINPIAGPGFGGFGFNPALNQGSGRWGSRFSNGPKLPKSTAVRFATAAWKFDNDRDAKLSREELEKVAQAVVAELKKNHETAYKKMKRGARGAMTGGNPVTQKDIAEVFVKQCLKYDRDRDAALNSRETDVMAAALVRFLQN